MADTYSDRLAETLKNIDAALGRDDEAPPRPELWDELTASATTEEAAGILLDAAASRARDLRRRIKGAQAAKDEATKEANLAAARIAEDEKDLAEIEDNLVRPLCSGFGKGKTHEVNTGYARVALVRNPPSVTMTEEAKRCEQDVMAMLPTDLLIIKPAKPNKTAIAEVLKAGKPVPGFILQTGATRVDWRS